MTLARLLSPSLYFLWFVIAFRIFTLVPAVRHKLLPIATNMGIEVFAVAIPMLIGFAAGGAAYLKTYIVVGYIEDLGFLGFLFWVTVELVHRGREGRRSMLWVFILWSVTAAATTCVVPHAIPLVTNPLVVPRYVSHVLFSWMAITMGFLSILIWITGALPDKPLGLTLLGLGINIACRAGLVTALLAHWSTAPQRLKSSVDLLYLVSLSLWSYVAWRAVPIPLCASQEAK